MQDYLRYYLRVIIDSGNPILPKCISMRTMSSDITFLTNTAEDAHLGFPRHNILQVIRLRTSASRQVFFYL